MQAGDLQQGDTYHLFVRNSYSPCTLFAGQKLVSCLSCMKLRCGDSEADALHQIWHYQLNSHTVQLDLSVTVLNSRVDRYMWLKSVFTIIVMTSRDIGLNCIISGKYYKLKRFLYVLHILQCNILTKWFFLSSQNLTVQYGSYISVLHDLLNNWNRKRSLLVVSLKNKLLSKFFPMLTSVTLRTWSFHSYSLNVTSHFSPSYLKVLCWISASKF